MRKFFVFREFFEKIMKFQLISIYFEYNKEEHLNKNINFMDGKLNY